MPTSPAMPTVVSHDHVVLSAPRIRGTPGRWPIKLRVLGSSSFGFFLHLAYFEDMVTDSSRKYDKTRCRHLSYLNSEPDSHLPMYSWFFRNASQPIDCRKRTTSTRTGPKPLVIDIQLYCSTQHCKRTQIKYIAVVNIYANGQHKSLAELPYRLPAEGEERSLQPFDQRPHVVERQGAARIVQLLVVQHHQQVAEQAAHHGDRRVQPCATPISRGLCCCERGESRNWLVCRMVGPMVGLFGLVVWAF